MPDHGLCILAIVEQARHGCNDHGENLDCVCTVPFTSTHEHCGSVRVGDSVGILIFIFIVIIVIITVVVSC